MNPDYLFHYTTADGAIGIVNNECLWATDIRFLNDSEEFIHGCKLVNEIAVELRSGSITHNFDANFLDNLLSATKSLLDGRDSSLTAYVISFSAQNDLLNQWRAYGGDSGYALGWKSEKLRQLVKLRRARLVKCIYDRDDQRRFVRRIIRYFAHRLKGLTGNDLFSCIDLIIKFMLQRFMPRLKHEAFREEQEWRIVITNNDEVKFRSGRLGVTPYISFSISNEAEELEAGNIFTEDSDTLMNRFLNRRKDKYMPTLVEIGPCENQKLAALGIEQLFYRTKKAVPGLKISELPYRHMRK